VQQRFKDSEHLLRMAGLFALGVPIFFVARAVLIPEGFGEMGHFRSGSLIDNRERPLHFAGAKVCADCHEDVLSVLSGGRHAGVRCEACHGPLADHASDPAAAAAKRPDPVALCPVCHQENQARPATFPQVDAKEHSSGASCSDCHKPHSPGMA